MRVLLFGASGRIGAEVRSRARAAGHDLVLFARDPAKLEPLEAGEVAFPGDMADPAAVAAAVEGVDAVVSVLGPTSNSTDQPALFEGFTRALIEAMERRGVRRLIAISGGACTLAGEHKRVSARVASGLVRLAVRHVVAAKQRELDLVAASTLDWTAPRPPRVVNSPATGTYRTGEDARGMSITRGDLANFIVDQLTDDQLLSQAPFISN